MESPNENLNKPKRHIFVTIWLIVIIAFNSFVAFIELIVFITNSQPEISRALLLLDSALRIATIVFVVMIFQWKAIGLVGLFAMNVILIIIHFFAGADLNEMAFSLAGFIIFCTILQIKKNKISAWEHLRQVAQKS